MSSTTLEFVPYPILTSTSEPGLSVQSILKQPRVATLALSTPESPNTTQVLPCAPKVGYLYLLLKLLILPPSYPPL